MRLLSILEHPAWQTVTALLMVIATGLLVCATWQLAKYAKAHSEYLARQEEHKIRAVYLDRVDDGKLSFVGLSLTNVGVPDITLMGIRLSLGVPNTESQTTEIRSALGWTEKHNGKPLSHFTPPHRLQTGETVKVLYDAQALQDRLDPGQRFRYECWDSFGRTYVSLWTDFDISTNSVGTHKSPGEGFHEPNPPREIRPL